MKLNIGIWVSNKLGISNIGMSLNNGHCTWLKVCVDWTIAWHSLVSCICVSHTFSYLICLHDYADMEVTNMTYGPELEIFWLSFLLRLTWRSSLLCCNNGDAEILYSRWKKEVYDCSDLVITMGNLQVLMCRPVPAPADTPTQQPGQGAGAGLYVGWAGPPGLMVMYH